MHRSVSTTSGASPASAGESAVGTEIAAVLADQRSIAALRAALARQCLERALRLLDVRHREDAGVLDGIAFLGEDAQHRVAMDHELREIGNRRWIRLRFRRAR